MDRETQKSHQFLVLFSNTKKIPAGKHEKGTAEFLCLVMQKNTNRWHCGQKKEQKKKESSAGLFAQQTHKPPGPSSFSEFPVDQVWFSLALQMQM